MLSSKHRIQFSALMLQTTATCFCVCVCVCVCVLLKRDMHERDTHRGPYIKFLKKKPREKSRGH
jgi:hypothetical protein